MTSFDKIFEKSDISEEKKKSKKIFGRLLINLRNTNHIKLYSLMESVIDTDLKENIVSLIFGDRTAFDMVNNQKDIELINTTLNSIECGLQCKIECANVKVFDEYQFERRLREEFSKILTIK